jgi:hypothetical protein
VWKILIEGNHGSTFGVALRVSAESHVSEELYGAPLSSLYYSLISCSILPLVQIIVWCYLAYCSLTWSPSLWAGVGAGAWSAGSLCIPSLRQAASHRRGLQNWAEGSRQSLLKGLVLSSAFRSKIWQSCWQHYWESSWFIFIVHLFGYINFE